jgi:hypothetical protein
MGTIKVTPEGRGGVWIADKDSVIDFLFEYEDDEIHNYIGGSGTFFGADWSVDSVIDKVKSSERIAILTGDSFKNNLRHALSVISGNELFMFDIGEIEEGNLNIGEQP